MSTPLRDRPIPLAEESLTFDGPEVIAVQTLMLPDGHLSKNKIRFGWNSNRDLVLNMVYLKKGVFADRLLEGIHITVTPIYKKEDLHV